LKIETHPRDDHQMTMIVELEPEKLESARKRAARRIAEKVKISGFRPGKAPYDVVRRLYGDGAITEEAVEILVDEIYPEAIKDANIEPAAAGQLENIESMDPPKFIFTVPLKPTVDLGEYKSVRLSYEFAAPDDTKLEEEITNLRRMYAKTETVDRPVEDGDYVMLDVVGHKAKSKEDEAPLLERKGFAIVAHADEKDTEWPFPGFATKLIGIKPGESKEFSHKYPKDFSEESLAGQNVKFEATIKTVRAVNMPDLDDEFAKTTGLGQSVDDLRQRMRENIETEARNTYEDEFYEKLIEQIKVGATIKYPPQVLDHEVEHVLEDVERRLKNQGIENMDAYYKMINTDKEKFIEEQARPTSVKRLERGLIMDELARAEKIEIDNESLEAEFNNAWATLAMTDEDFAKRTKNGTKASREIVDAVAMDSANRLLTRRVLDRLKAIAAGEVADAVEAKPAKAKKAKKAAAAEVDTAPVEATTEAAAPAPAKKRVSKKKAEAE
jgi:trigger factor